MTSLSSLSKIGIGLAIAAAGVVYYTVHLQGGKAVYFGRHGDSFTEPFPTV